ncbi:hypothetical protein GmHk_07G019984 [Glycine max]|nr:hypothetical protein GmHk_07G019984 [Glycine max]
MQREEKIWLVCFQKEKYDMESRRRTGTRWRIPLHPTTTFSQQRKAWPRLSALSNTSAMWWIAIVAPVAIGYSSTYPPMSTLDRYFTSSDAVS